MPVSASLFMLVAVVLVPTLVFNGLLLKRYADTEHAASSAAAENVASRIADAVDRELAGMVATLSALQMSQALRTDDLAAFGSRAEAASANGTRFLIAATPDGRELFRSGGSPHGGSWAPPTGQPPGSDLLRRGEDRFARVAVPFRPSAQQAAPILSFELPAPVLVDLLRTQELPPGWIVALVDSTDAVMSRTVDSARFVGQPAGVRRRAVNDQGAWRGTTLTGQPAIIGYARLHLANWCVTAAAPLAILERPLRQTLLLLGGGGVSLALLSVFLAMRLARQISAPLHALAGAGAVLGRGDVLPPVATRVREVAYVASALRSASIELRRHGDALNAERVRLHAIIETVPVGLLIVGPDGVIESGNAQMAEVTGGGSGTGPLALDLRMADGSRLPPDALPPGRALRGEANPELECRLHRQDGSSIWIYLIAAPIHDRTGRVTGAVVAALNIEDVVRARDEKARSAVLLEHQVAERTQQLRDANARLRHEIAGRTEVEAQLRQVQKMEAVGQLTGGIAHDFNNLLTIVIGCLDMLRHRVGDDRSRRLADNAIDGAQRAAVLTARLLAFSRQQPLLPRSLDLNRLVEDMAELLRRTLGEPVELQTRLAPGLWLVNADPNQLENALLNLALNAKDAIAALPNVQPGEARGQLLLATANAVLRAGEFVDVAGGDYVSLAVSDTGAGMPADVAVRVFEPFFTTKPVGQGTGLGLSQVHGFVKQSGGHVTVSSREGPGHGTVVTLYLPRDPDAVQPGASAPASPAEAPAPVAGRSLVLVVEDEPRVRSFACDALEELGYTVLAAGDVAGARDIIARTPDIAVLFTDMVLPEGSGRGLAEYARRKRPGLPVLFTTGHTAGRASREDRLGPGEGLIDKPYTAGQLAESVAALLNAPG